VKNLIQKNFKRRSSAIGGKKYLFGRKCFQNFQRNEAVKEMIKRVIKICREKGKYIGICGDIPSTDPDYALWLAKEGIEAISLSPDAVMKTILHLMKK
jgi:phosphoenolpyruvate synthase/pyruvate phosphate dikinase